MEKRRVPFVGAHNAGRSQMAEALVRHYADDRFDARSAGMQATEVHPMAIAVMAELGIDIGAQRAKTVDRFLRDPFDWVITVCDTARDACPDVPGADHGHWGFDDPAFATGTDEERMAVYRRIRDEIAGRVRMFVLAAQREDVPRPAPTILRGS